MIELFLKSLSQNLNKQNLLLYTLMNEVFNPSTLPWYSWMKKGFPAEKLFRNTTDRSNAIAAQWEKNVYFMIKSETSNEESISYFIKNFFISLNSQCQNLSWS